MIIRAGITIEKRLAKDNTKKIDPELVSWNNLTNDKKNKIYEMVKAWPKILAKSNFKIERLKFMCYCETKL